MTASPRTLALRAFVAGAPLAFAALLTRHPMGGGTLYDGISPEVGAWLAVHYASAILFPLMALVVWLLIRELPGRAAAVSRWALPVFAVLYGVWETMFGIANGMIAQAGSDLGPAARGGARAASELIVDSPLVGELSVFNALGTGAWLVAIVGAIVALKHAGRRTSALILLALAGALVMHVPPIGPVALVCLSGAALLLERERAAAAPRQRAAAAPGAPALPAA
jgi:hypothetical protein